MLFHIEVRIAWADGSHMTVERVRAVSRKHALDKAIAAAKQWPQYLDHSGEQGRSADLEATIIAATT